MSDFFDGKVCFLSSPDWQSLLRETWATSGSSAISELFFDYTYYLSLAGPLVGRGYDLREQMEAGKAVNPADIMTLLQKTIDMYGRLRTWAERLHSTVRLPEEVPSSQGDELFPTVYQYDDVSIGALFCGYYALTIVFQLIFMIAGYGNFAQSTQDFADKICKSVEFVGTGPLGPYRIGFSMRIAYEVESKARKLWIRNQLSKYSKKYAAIDVQSYPDLNKEYSYG
jgi:hypothetical protein